MQEESRWRYALAQQIAPHYHANPKVAAVLIEGSVARDDADRSSDLDLAVFWAEPPTAQERRDILTRALGRDRPPSSSPREAAGWQTRNVRGGVAIDVRHTTVAATEGLLAAVLEHADPRLARQQRLAALRSALPLVNPALIIRWQQQAAAYPHAMAVAMIQKHLRFRPAWEQEQLAERHEVLVLYDSFCTAYKQLLLVLLGLNHLYYPGWRWLDRLMDQMQMTPPNLSLRLKQLFAIVSIDPLASVYQLHDLIEETFALVESQFAAVDTRRARARFHERGKHWEHSDGLG
jgi:predicted nucleotidyltransferase